jgi:ABC-type transport system involved in multi-copper enzyme maturation permease subunit
LTQLGKIYAIALNTFRETVRDKILYSFLVFIVLVMLLAILLGSLSVGQDERVLRDFGLASISFVGGVIAIFAGANLVFKELDKRTVYIIFTKPVTGWQFILGKYLGLSFAVGVMVLAMGLFMGGVLALTNNHPFAFELGRLSAPLALVYLELLFVIALATFFSTFANPIMSVLFTLSLWLIGHFGDSLRELGRLSQNHNLAALMNFIYWLLPDLASLTRVRSLLMYGNQFGNQFGNQSGHEVISYLSCYVIAYVLILLVLASIVTERREI